MSGSAVTKGPMVTHQRHLAVKQAEFMNCPTNSSEAIVECLMKTPWRELGDSLTKFFVSILLFDFSVKIKIL